METASGVLSTSKNGRRSRYSCCIPQVQPVTQGVLHTTGGYMVYASATHEYVFDYKAGEVLVYRRCGLITGHSYMVYGPLANGATVLIHEGVPNHPSPARLGEMIDRHKVVFFTQHQP